MKRHILHVVYRIVGLILLFGLTYVIILDGRSDEMGLGLLYAFIVVSVIAPIYLFIEAAVLSKNNKKTEAKISRIIAISLIVLLLALFNMD